MANPLSDLNTAINTVVSTIPDITFMGIYNGEASKDWNTLFNQIELHQNCCWTRIYKVIPRQQNDTPIDEDDVYINAHLLIGSTKVADRTSSTSSVEIAQQKTYDIYQALRSADWNSLGITWLHEIPHLNNMAIEIQTPNTTIFSLIITFTAVFESDYIPLTPGGGNSFMDLFTDLGEGNYQFNGSLTIDGSLQADVIITTIDGGTA